MARILIIGINFAPELIGVGKYSGELASYLASAGDDVRVITAPPHYPNWIVRAPYSAWRFQTEQMGSIVVARCPIWTRNNGRGIWRLLAPLSFAISALVPTIKNIIVWRPNVIICVEPSFLSCIIPVLLARILRIKTILHVQDLEIDAAFAVGYISGSYFKTIAFTLERFILNLFDGVATISGKMAKRLIDKKLKPDKIYIVRNWIDPEMFKDASAHRAREGLNFKNARSILLYSGHIGKKQDLNTVLCAAEILCESPDFQFVIAGDGPEKEKLQTRFAHLSNVTWLPLQPVAQFHDLLLAAKCHLLPQHESAADLVLPSKLGAILATGSSLIVTAHPDTELALFLGDNAIIVPPNDATQLARAILKSGSEDHMRRIQRLELAEQLSTRHILPKFREIILRPK